MRSRHLPNEKSDIWVQLKVTHISRGPVRVVTNLSVTLNTMSPCHCFIPRSPGAWWGGRRAARRRTPPCTTCSPTTSISSSCRSAPLSRSDWVYMYIHYSVLLFCFARFVTLSISGWTSPHRCAPVPSPGTRAPPPPWPLTTTRWDWVQTPGASRSAH